MVNVNEPPLDDATARLIEEHRQIEEVIGHLHQVRDLPELLRRLEELRALLVPHFVAEQAPGGFFEVLRARAARHFERLANLEHEHWTLLDEINHLADEAGACLAGPVAAILARAGALAGHLKAHEAGEEGVFIDSMYTDLGGQ